MRRASNAATKKRIILIWNNRRGQPVAPPASAYTPMTARAQNKILKSLVEEEINSGRAACQHSQSKAAAKPRRENGAWYIVATDGSTSVITSKPANAPKSGVRDQAIAENPPKKSRGNNEPPPHELEPGVDLSYLNMEKETASKLIAGMHAMTADETATPLQGEIEMPSAKTDLKEIFKSDQVCMVSTHKVV